MLTFDQAESILQDAFKEKYKSLVFKRTTYHDGKTATLVQGYVDALGWTQEVPTFEEVIRILVQKDSASSEGIHD